MNASADQDEDVAGSDFAEINAITSKGHVVSEGSEEGGAALAMLVAEHQRASQEYWDAKAEKPFLDLGQLLLYADCRPDQLATAIEKHGIQGWDRFGRFTSFSSTSPQGQQALDALAHARSLYLEKGTYKLEEFVDAPFDRFGWLSDVMPDLDLASSAGPASPDEPPEHRKAQAKEIKIRNARELTHVIGALLMFIRGEVSEHKHPDYAGQTKLIDLLDAEFDGYSGVTEGYLTKLFPDANGFMKLPPKKG
jgi:hypothetical protein